MFYLCFAVSYPLKRRIIITGFVFVFRTAGVEEAGSRLRSAELRKQQLFSNRNKLHGNRPKWAVLPQQLLGSHFVTFSGVGTRGQGGQLPLQKKI